MKTQKFLVKDNKHEAEREVKMLESFIPTLNQLKEVYESLDLGELDEKTALSLLSDTGATAGEMFLNAIAADCLATGNRNKNFINQMVKSQEQTVNNFKTEVKRVLAECGYFNSTRFSYSEIDGYFLTKESIKNIQESHKVYLTNENEIKLFKSFENASESLKSLRTDIESFSKINYHRPLMPFLERENNFNRELILDLNIESILELIKRLRPRD